MPLLKDVDTFVILTSLVPLCSGMLIYTGKVASADEWLAILLNVWLLILGTGALWRYLNPLPQNENPRPPQPSNNASQTPVDRVPVRRLRDPRGRCRGACLCRRCFPSVPSSGNWAPQYHTHIYCQGLGLRRSLMYDDDEPQVENRHRRGYDRRPPRRGRDISPRLFRFSPVNDLSSLSGTPSNEPAHVPLNTPEISNERRDEDSESQNSFSSTQRPNRVRNMPMASTPRRVIPASRLGLQVHHQESSF